MKRKIKVKVDPYRVVYEALESGLRFGVKQMGDLGVYISDDQEERIINRVLFELWAALDGVCSFK